MAISEHGVFRTRCGLRPICFRREVSGQSVPFSSHPGGPGGGFCPDLLVPFPFFHSLIFATRSLPLLPIETRKSQHILFNLIT